MTMDEKEAEGLCRRVVVAGIRPRDGMVDGFGGFGNEPRLLARYEDRNKATEEDLCTVDDYGEIRPFRYDLWAGYWWPDLRDPGTFGLVYAQWQARPGHTFKCPCPVMTYAAVYGITSKQAIVALVAALEANPLSHKL